jgi:sensor c-di-GMP phosphodiesterase-like protein
VTFKWPERDGQAPHTLALLFDLPTLLPLTPVAPIVESAKPGLIEPNQLENLRQDLIRAISGNELVLHYQPKVDIASGRIVGAEALVRWDRPGVGLVPPGEFLPLIERSGFAVEFGFEVLAEVLATWQRSLRDALVATAGPAAYVAVNVDAQQLADPGFEAFVRSALVRTGMDPGELVLELTEHTAVDVAHADMLERLRAAGIGIAVDDFGSGYSSLGQSTQLPVDILKLDRSFVVGVLESDHDLGLFADLARLADTLGMGITAEGIETAEVAAMLLDAGILTGQGFLFTRALPESELVDWVRARAGTADVVQPAGALGSSI